MCWLSLILVRTPTSMQALFVITVTIFEEVGLFAKNFEAISHVACIVLVINCDGKANMGEGRKKNVKSSYISMHQLQLQ